MSICSPETSRYRHSPRSVARTGRLLCVGEAFPWGRVTAEVLRRAPLQVSPAAAAPARLNAKDPRFLTTELFERTSTQREDDCGEARQVLAE